MPKENAPPVKPNEVTYPYWGAKHPIIFFVRFLPIPALF